MSQTSSEQQSPGQVQGRQQSHPPSKRKGSWRTPAIVAALVSAGVVIAAAIIPLVWLRPIPTPVLASTISLMLAPLPPPSVTITDPTEGNMVAEFITVQGTASNIPAGKELWLFVTVKVPGVNGYFPQANDAKNPSPITVEGGGTWSVAAHIGSDNDTGIGFTLIPALIDQYDTTAHDAIRAYFLQILQTQGPYKGIDPMYLTRVQWMKQIHVQRM